MLDTKSSSLRFSLAFTLLLPHRCAFLYLFFHAALTHRNDLKCKETSPIVKVNEAHKYNDIEIFQTTKENTGGFMKRNNRYIV